MPCTVVVGGFYGDEGKGKVIAYLAQKDNPSVAVRGGVGPNAGHTVVLDGKIHKVRMLPSAVVNPKTKLMIGPGVLVDPQILENEIELFNARHRTFIDLQCPIIEQRHLDADNSLPHLKEKVGTTGTGTGPANAERAIRMIKIAKNMPGLSLLITDVANHVNTFLDNKENVLVEGTQGTFLSLYYGDYPYVTSKDVTASAICSDVGIGPRRVNEVVVVFKAYVTRVGGGQLNNELRPEEAKKRGWEEYGSVTGRQRRAAPFDMDLAKRAVRLNAASQLAITKLDVLFESCSSVREFEKLPKEAQHFIELIEVETGIPVTLIGTGAEVYDVIDRRRM
jgi:adenylosuccinate synthase